MKKLVVLISGNGSNLQAIIDSCKKKKINGTVCAVFSNKKNIFGLFRAKSAGIPVHVLHDSNFYNRESLDKVLIKQIDAYSPDLIVLAGYMRILSPLFINHYYGHIINIHPSLLPKYPGLNTHNKVLENYDKEHGISVHFVTNKLDSGPIIVQAEIPVLIEDKENILVSRIKRIEHIIYPLVIDWFFNSRLKISNNIVYFDGIQLSTQGIKFYFN